MTVKMIASDMDGTFLQAEDQYDVAHFAKVLAQLKEKDIRFVAASGRQVSNLRALFAPMADYGLLDQIDFVGSNGSVVATADQELYAVYLKPEQIRKVIDWNAVNFSPAENLVVMTGAHGSYLSNHATADIMAMLAPFYPNLTQVDKLLDVDDQILGVSFIWPHDKVQEYVRLLMDTFGDQLHATGSGFGSVDILPKNVNKATALEVLQDYYNIDDSAVMVFGDNANDLEMLSKYDQAYLMPNAASFMHQAHDQEAIAPNDEAGVLATIEAKLFLDQ
ncbi:HAD hydrolase family protein [Leuconostocaceae bacterium ESL0958]|nr:HAD hydrolase family protein [Leuconostocaceae bacterium ESL0958]